MALIGAGLFFVLLAGDLPSLKIGHWSELPWRLIIRYIVTMSLGGGIAGWLLSGLFGRRGIAGWVLAALGAVLATMVAGLIGSALGQLPDLLRDGWQAADMIPIVFGLVVLPLAFAGKPLLFLAWAVLVGLTHVLASRARAASGPR